MGQFNRCKLTRLCIDTEWEKKKFKEHFITKTTKNTINKIDGLDEIVEEEVDEERLAQKREADNDGVTQKGAKRRKVEELNDINWGVEIREIAKEKVDFLYKDRNKSSSSSSKSSSSVGGLRQSTIFTISGRDLIIKETIRNIISATIARADANRAALIVATEIEASNEVFEDLDEAWAPETKEEMKLRKKQMKELEDLWKELEISDRKKAKEEIKKEKARLDKKVKEEKARKKASNQKIMSNFFKKFAAPEDVEMLDISRERVEDMDWAMSVPMSNTQIKRLNNNKERAFRLRKAKILQLEFKEKLQIKQEKEMIISNALEYQ